MNSTAAPNRDPVCGMTVDPTTSKYSHVYEGTTWYFCADHCRQQFIAHPKQYIGKEESDTNTVTHRKTSWSREGLVWALVFAGVVIVVIAGRGLAKKVLSSTPGTTVIGTAASPHQTIDGGQGGVIAEAIHEQKVVDLEFTVSLDTHTVDLSDFDPSTHISLQTAHEEVAPRTAIAAGERSSHHQNYRVSFPRVNETNVMLVVRDVGGIAQRELPFRL